MYARYAPLPTVEMSELNSNGACPGAEAPPPDSYARSLKSNGLKYRRKNRLNTELLQAVYEGKEDNVISALIEGASCDATCRVSGVTGIHLAAYLGHHRILDILLRGGGHGDRRDRRGREPAHLAAWAGHCSALQLLHSFNDPQRLRAFDSTISPYPEMPPLDPGDSDSWSHNHEQLINLVDEELTEGSTPIHLACERIHADSISFLLSCGASVSIKNQKGLTALDVVGLSVTDGVQNSHDNEEDARPEDQGVSFFRTGISKKFLFRQGSEDKRVLGIISALMERGAKLPKTKSSVDGSNQKPNTMCVTPLHTAVENMDLESIDFLLEKDACIRTWNQAGETALHLAVRKQLSEPLKKMLSGAQSCPVVDVRDSSGRTPLHLAISLQWAQGFDILIESGADLKATTNQKETVLHLAAERGSHAMLEELLSIFETVKLLEDKNKYMLTPLSQAVYSNSLECVKLLVSYGADVDVKLPGDLSLLHIAAGNNSLDMIKYLLEIGVKDSRSSEERGGRTALHIAAQEGHGKCVEALLKGGCDMLSTTTYEPHKSSTALHLAARENRLESIEAILKFDKNKVALNAVDGQGRQPLHVAALNGHGAAIRTLLLEGADIAARHVDENGATTALDLIVYSVPQPILFLEQILDSYIRVNDFPLNDPACEVKIQYDLLMPHGTAEKQLTVLTAVLNSSRQRLQERLLIHPVIETFLTLKWFKLRSFFFFLTGLYFLLTISITNLALIKYVNENIPEFISTFGTIFFTIVLVFSSIPVFAAEIVNASQLQKYYIRDVESWVKWLLFCGIWAVCLVDPSQEYGRYVAGVTILLAWMEVLFLIARCPVWGYYVLMFSKVAVNLFKVLASFIFLLVGFTFAFLITFNATDPFATLWQAFVKVIVMLNELDFAGAFPEESTAGGAFSVVGRGLFVLFVILVAIVLTNLMVGLAVSDITLLETQGRTQRLAKQIDFLSLLEMLVYNKLLSKCCLPRCLCSFIKTRRFVDSSLALRPGTPHKGRFRDLPRPVRDSLMEKVAASHQFRTDSSDNLHKIDDTVQKILQTVSQLQPNENVEEMFRSILTRLEQMKPNSKVEENTIPNLTPNTNFFPIGFQVSPRDDGPLLV